MRSLWFHVAAVCVASILTAVIVREQVVGAVLGVSALRRRQQKLYSLPLGSQRVQAEIAKQRPSTRPSQQLTSSTKPSTSASANPGSGSAGPSVVPQHPTHIASHVKAYVPRQGECVTTSARYSLARSGQKEAVDADKFAYILCARTKKTSWAWYPMHVTLAEALSGLGFQVSIGFVEDTCTVRARALHLLKKNKATLIIGTSPHRVMDPEPSSFGGGRMCRYGDTLRRLVARGAFLVLSNSEPMRDAEKVIAAARGWGARELWQYSRHIMNQYVEGHGHELAGIKVRYMPAGCADALNFGVVSNAINRDESRVSALFHWRERPDKSEFQDAFGELLVPIGDGLVCAPNEYRDFIARYPVQLNAHSAWNSVSPAAESVRFSVLLSNKACVLSADVDEADASHWRSLVKFGSPSELRNIFQSLRGNSTAIRECQEEGHKNFCERFKPLTLIQNAGFTGKEADRRRWRPQRRLSDKQWNMRG